MCAMLNICLAVFAQGIQYVIWYIYPLIYDCKINLDFSGKNKELISILTGLL